MMSSLHSYEYAHDILRYKTRQTFNNENYLFGNTRNTRKLIHREIKLLKEIEYHSVFARTQHGDYGIVTEDDPKETTIEITLVDGRTWRVQRDMVQIGIYPPSCEIEKFQSILPTCSNDQFDTYPSIADLRTMNPKQLAKVQNFEVVHIPTKSRIFFHGTTDLTGVDIAKAIRLSCGNIEFYPEIDCPPPGKKLNRSARVELHGCFPNDECANRAMSYEEIEKFGRYLIRLCEKQNYLFISYIPEENGKLTFDMNVPI
jgi:hypothetical protein